MWAERGEYATPFGSLISGALAARSLPPHTALLHSRASVQFENPEPGEEVASGIMGAEMADMRNNGCGEGRGENVRTGPTRGQRNSGAWDELGEKESCGKGRWCERGELR